MNKSIVYFLVLSSFIVGCGQGFEGNLAQVKDAAPFNESVDAQDSQQQTDTTRPLQDNLQPSPDEEGVPYVYNIDPSVDGNFNNTVDRTSSAFYLDQLQNNNPEIAIQGVNWSQNQKLNVQQGTDDTTPSAQFSVTHDTPNSPKNSVQSANNSVTNDTPGKPETTSNSTQTSVPTAHESVTNDTPGKPAKNSMITTSSDEEGEYVAWNTTSDSLVSTELVAQNKNLQNKAVLKSKCSSFKLFDNHKQNLDKYMVTFEKLLTYVKVNNKTNIVSNINCETLNGNAGVIYSNFKKLDKMNLKVLSQGRPSVRPLKLLFAEIIKSNINKNDHAIDIILITDPNSIINEITNDDLVTLMTTSNKIPVLISTEESFNKWVQAINTIKGI